MLNMFYTSTAKLL